MTVVVDECSGWNVQAFFRGSLDWHWEVEGFIDLMFSSEKQKMVIMGIVDPSRLK